MFESSLSSRYKNVIFILMAILIIFFIAKIADIAIMFFGAFIITASILPVINKLKKYMPRTLSVIIVLLLVLMGILLVFVPLAILTVNQIAAFFEQAPSYISKLQDFMNINLFGHSLKEFINFNSLDNVGTSLSEVAGNILNRGLTAGKAVMGSITSTFAVMIIVFYLSLDEEHMQKAYLSFFPPKFKKKAKEVLDILTIKVGGYVLAQILSMLSVGVFTFIGLLLLHHPNALLVSFLTFILDLIPVVGATVAVTLGVLSGYEGGIGYMAGILVVMLIAQWLQNQIVRPLLFGKFMDIHPLLVIISLLIGAKFLGFLGVILGPAFASLICVLVNELYIKQINNGK